ncbi:hypothetical protein [Methanobrevibacter olleyae]|uniref:Uncharacterized protein n=1 Tax=Methanobrevibacter olleyae TaxID=294671 RepID=A0A126QZS8_METOL|nr:hypothetical protein [Methanobrevibacter olleyae]AMK14885.1 hypothetical protein YLM1_0325 [Methanobrevibacter olleyae]SFL44526.1 hypothetical protein SAMN02910297_00906 [Methanobrevibacter olleyae]
MFIIFNEDLEFKGKSIPRVVLGNAPFLADAYFGHRTRLYNLDLLRNPNNVSKIIEKSYELGVRSINLANKENLLKAFEIASNDGVEMQAVSTIGKTEMDYVLPNYDEARREATWKEDIENLAQFDNSLMLVDEFLIDTYDWDFITEILEAINDTGIPSGIITSFPFKTSEKLIDSPIIEDKGLFDFYMIPVNKVGYMMDVPDFRANKQEELVNLLNKIDKKIIINKILAVGIQRPEEAFNFLKTLDYAEMVSVGIASEMEAEETFGILNKI